MVRRIDSAWGRGRGGRQTQASAGGNTATARGVGGYQRKDSRRPEHGAQQAYSGGLSARNRDAAYTSPGSQSGSGHTVAVAHPPSGFAAEKERGAPQVRVVGLRIRCCRLLSTVNRYVRHKPVAPECCRTNVRHYLPLFCNDPYEGLPQRSQHHHGNCYSTGSLPPLPGGNRPAQLRGSSMGKSDPTKNGVVAFGAASDSPGHHSDAGVLFDMRSSRGTRHDGHGRFARLVGNRTGNRDGARSTTRSREDPMVETRPVGKRVLSVPRADDGIRSTSRSVDAPSTQAEHGPKYGARGPGFRSPPYQKSPGRRGSNEILDCTHDEGDRQHVPANALDSLPEICRLDACTAQVVSQSWHPPAKAAGGQRQDHKLFRPLESGQARSNASPIRPSGHLGERGGLRADVTEDHQRAYGNWKHTLQTNLQDSSIAKHNLWENGFRNQMEHAAAGDQTEGHFGGTYQNAHTHSARPWHVPSGFEMAGNFSSNLPTNKNNNTNNLSDPH